MKSDDQKSVNEQVITVKKKLCYGKNILKMVIGDICAFALKT